MISTFLYYTIIASAVLFYGIGIDRTVSLQKKQNGTFLTFIKAIFTSAATSAVGFVVSKYILIPIQLEELYPFVTLLIFLLFSSLIEIFVDVGLREAPVEFAIPLLSSYLAINEGMNVAYAVLISFASIISFYMLIGIFHSVQERISFYTTRKGLHTYCVLLLCLAFLIIAIAGFNGTWIYLSLGGVK